MRRRTRRQAFTLIEVLLVAGILALLAAFAIPTLFQKARETEIKLTESQIGRNGPIAKALENYKFDMGAYPESDEGLSALFAPKSRSGDNDRYKGPYLEGTYEELKDSWGHAFEYKAPGDFHPEGYDLWSRGPDGVDDGGRAGSDDIKNWIEK